MTSATTFSTKNPPDSGGGPGAATDGKPRDRCAGVALANDGRILLVDDEDAVLRALARELGAAGRRVDRCADPREAVQRLARDESAWIVFDDRMPDLGGMALMEPVWRLAAETLRFLLTAHPDLDSAVRAINEGGVHRFLSKPWKQDEPLFDCIDRCRGYLFPDVVLAFIRETQPQERAFLEKLQGVNAAATLLDDLCRALNSEHEGCLHALRHGFMCFGRLFRAACFAPASGLNLETRQLYAANRLAATRQLLYSAPHERSVVLVLSLNGIPLVTAELKNPFTGQTWRDAVRQYKRDRDHTDRFIRDSLSRFPQPRRAACGAACVVIESGARFHPAAQLWPPLEYALQ